MGVELITRTENIAEHVVRPRRQAYRSIGLACLALFAPIFAVLYWLTIPQGTWPAVLLAQTVLLTLTALVLGAAARRTIGVGEAGLTCRGPFGRTVTHPLDLIDRVLLVEVYRIDETETEAYLLVADHRGNALLRMHSPIYAREAMDTVIDELGAPVERMLHPVTLADLNRSWPHLLAWFEWRPSRLLPAR